MSCFPIGSLGSLGGDKHVFFTSKKLQRNRKRMDGWIHKEQFLLKLVGTPYGTAQVTSTDSCRWHGFGADGITGHHFAKQLNLFLMPTSRAIKKHVSPNIVRQAIYVTRFGI